MKSFKLDWSGWWLLRSPMPVVPALEAKSAVFAVIGARIRKVSGGMASSAREVIMFGAHQGEDTVGEHLAKLLRMSLGVFVIDRCRDIRKYPIVYAAPLPDASADDLRDVVAALYKSVPGAPRHHAVPDASAGSPVLLFNGGKNPGLPETLGAEAEYEGDAGATVVPDADAAMAGAIAREFAATRRMTAEEADVHGIATEKVAKPAGYPITEKVDKPAGFEPEDGAASDHTDDTEYAGKPGSAF